MRLSRHYTIADLSSDVSTSFKRIQAEKLAADAVLREFTPIETMQDVDGLRNYMENLNLKTEVCHRFWMSAMETDADCLDVAR